MVRRVILFIIHHGGYLKIELINELNKDKNCPQERKTMCFIRSEGHKVKTKNLTNNFSKL